MNRKFGDYKMAILTIFIVVIYLIFKQELSEYLFPDDMNRNGELAKLLLSVIGGIGVLYGLIISNRRALITEKSVLKQGEQIELARKSQIDERFKNAVEHLGNEKEPIILGGVSELVQIAKEDSVKYKEVVFNILCSYIRSETNVYTKKANDFSSTVIRTIINYLFRNDKNNLFIGLNADLSTSNLGGQNIDSCNFSKGNLQFTYLANITNSTFEDCILDRAIINSSLFKNNILKGAKLFQTHFTFVEFVKLEFKSSILKENNEFISSNFIHCKFFDVSFNKRDIYQSNFIGCIFRNCTFNDCNIIDSKFLLSNFSNCNFSNVKILSEVDFRGSIFNDNTFPNYMNDCIFRGARIGPAERIFIRLDMYIKESKSNKSRIAKDYFTNTILKNCDFTDFTDLDGIQINDFCEELQSSHITHRKLEKSKTNNTPNA